MAENDTPTPESETTAQVVVTTTPVRRTGIASAGALRVGLFGILGLLLLSFLVYGWVVGERARNTPKSSVANPIGGRDVDPTPALRPDPDVKKLIEQEAAVDAQRAGMAAGQTRAALPPLMAGSTTANQSAFNPPADQINQQQYIPPPPPPPPRPGIQALLELAQATKTVRGIAGARGAHVTPVNNSVPAPAANTAAEDSLQLTLGLPVGALLRARLEVGVNSDYPTQITARVLDDEARDIVLVGQVVQASSPFARDRVLMSFDRAYRPQAPNKAVAITAIAVDPASRIPALKGKTHRHVLENTVFYLGGAFLEAYGSALAQNYTQARTTIGLNDSVVLSARNLDPARTGAAQALGSLSFGRRSIRPPTIQIPAGTLLGVVILSSGDQPVPVAAAPDNGSPYGVGTLGGNPALPVFGDR